MDDPKLTSYPAPPQSRERLAELRDRLMKLVNPATVPSGILHWSPPGSPALILADGTRAAPALTKQKWRELYFGLRKGALASGELPTLEEIEAQAAGYQATGTIPIAIAHYRYHAPRRRFLARVQTYADRGGTFDLPDPLRPESVLKEQTAFFASTLPAHEFNLFFPAPPIHYGLTARFVLPSSLYLTNTGSAPGSVEVDLDDEQGYRRVAFDQPLTTTYAQAGVKHLRLRMETDRGALRSTFDLNVQDQAAPTPNETWQLTSPITFNGLTNTGHAWVYYGAGRTALANPLIVVEGFPGGYSLDYLWSVLDENDLVTDLLEQGKDVIILGFEKATGTSYVEANAGVVIAGIQRAIKERQGAAPLVVGGASMGGLVSRYALAYMETHNLAHEANLYFSFDSPHQGANVPASILYFLSYFASESDFVKQANEQIISPAAQEMLLYWLPDYEHEIQAPAPLRTTFLANLAAVGGFPQKPRKIGVSNGVGTGQGNTTPPGANTLYWSYYDCAGTYLYAAPGDSDPNNLHLVCEAFYGSTSYFNWSAPGDPAFDSCPGGTNDFFNQIAAGLKAAGYSPTLYDSLGCFIPAISSLALSTLDPYSQADLFRDLSSAPPPSLLDDYLYSTMNDPHVTVTPAIAAWLLKAVSVGADQPPRWRAPTRARRAPRPA